MRKNRKQTEPDSYMLMSGVCFIIVFCLHILSFFPGQEFTYSYFYALLLIVVLAFVPSGIYIQNKTVQPPHPMSVKQVWKNIIYIGKQPFYEQLATIIFFYTILNFIFCVYEMGDEFFYIPEKIDIPDDIGDDIYLLRAKRGEGIISMNHDPIHYYRNMSYFFRIATSWGMLLTYVSIYALINDREKLKTKEKE